MEEDELYANRFRGILNTFNINQLDNFPTHIQGHTLDIVAPFGENPTISGIESSKYDISHHFLIDVCVAIKSELKLEKEISYRNL